MMCIEYMDGFMNKTRLLILLLFILFGILTFIFLKKKATSELKYNDKHHHFVVAQGHVLLGFDLVDPEEAPPDIAASVLRGYRLMMNTAEYAPGYAMDQISCTHCHFMGGDTLGGKSNGISLVGVTTVYPQFSERSGHVISLAERINNCFERSLNGRPLPEDSQHMKDLLTYLKWISKEVEGIKHIPWLGLTPLKSNHQADAIQGEKIYQTYCALCHKEDGEGGGILSVQSGKTIPPLWGPHSFNDGAGMNRLKILSSFVYWNMPYHNVVLSEEQALDVAAFVLKQPRPHYTPSTSKMSLPPFRKPYAT